MTVVVMKIVFYTCDNSCDRDDVGVAYKKNFFALTSFAFLFFFYFIWRLLVGLFVVCG